MINIKDENQVMHISFDNEYLSKDIVNKLKCFLQNNLSKKSIALDLTGVESVQNDFFSVLKEFSCCENFALYNVGVDINLLINIMNYRKQMKMFANKEDCNDNKRQLIHRNFKLCN